MPFVGLVLSEVYNNAHKNYLKSPLYFITDARI